MIDEALRILLIEDSPGDARYIRELLRDATALGERTSMPPSAHADRDVDTGPESVKHTLIHESTLSSGLDRLGDGDSNVDVVLLDLNLPDSQRLETLESLRRVAETVPVIVLTGLRDREMGIEAFHKGADEYLVKDQLTTDLLIRSIYHAIAHREHERELTRQRDELQEKTDRLEQFAGIVAHDLRNPLSVAAGSLELARRTGDEDSLDRAEDALVRMEHLIDDLLMLASLGEHVEDTRPTDLQTASRNAWAFVQTGDATLETGELSGGYEIVADAKRLEQLLENLFRNAVQHGGPGVTVRVGSRPDGFYVEDTGPGIPASERPLVFEAGHSSDPTGTGFGLSIVRDIAHAHGWEVAVADGSTGGARFEFTGVEHA